jgi:hypothetical protein
VGWWGQARTSRPQRQDFFDARGEQVLGTWSSRDPVADQHYVDQPLHRPSVTKHVASPGTGQPLHSGRRLVVV